MEMSEWEICSRYRRNGCYKRHVQILAELNAADDGVMLGILRRGGVYKPTGKEKGAGKLMDAMKRYLHSLAVPP